MTDKQIDDILTYRPPAVRDSIVYGALRHEAQEVALLIEQYFPDSWERSIAFARLQEAVMWANAAIAINEKDPHAGKEAI